MYESDTIPRKGYNMKSQVAKRINVNLTQKQLDELRYIEKRKTGEKYIDSDIIRDAIDMYAQLLGYNE